MKFPDTPTNLTVIPKTLQSSIIRGMDSVNFLATVNGAPVTRPPGFSHHRLKALGFPVDVRGRYGTSADSIVVERFRFPRVHVSVLFGTHESVKSKATL